MSVSWTEEQQKVISLRDRNILVSAAAGSGKTAVLVERIITMLMDEAHPLDVDRLLVVTFTEAAAAEMKERIRNAIEAKLETSPDNEHLRQQATLIHSAQITTIHSFCLAVIRDHFHAIDIDPGFRIGEEGELKLLKHDVLEHILEENYEKGDRQFLEFIDAYAVGRDDKKVEELILKLYEYSRSYPDAEKWLYGCVAAYGTGEETKLEHASYITLIKERVTLYIEDAMALLEQALSLCQEADGPAVYEGALLSDAQMLEEFQAAKSYEALYQAASRVSWERLRANRDKTVSEEKMAMVKAIREDIKAIVKDLINQYFYQDMSGVEEDTIICKQAMAVLAGLVVQFAEAYGEKKRSQNMIDFADMEQYALRILAENQGEQFVPSAIAAEYQRQYAEIMIDEYQDSNLIQETILTSVSTVSAGRNNVFMVGDVKQSIYRFRLSRPELFMDKFHNYTVTDGICQRIDLHKNFRSRREVLESVNYLFEQIMTPSLGGITYDNDAALNPGADYPESCEEEHNNTEVIIVETKDSGNDRELEAKAIGMRIRKLMETQRVLDKKTGEYRKARYSDIVILTRSVKGFTDVFSEVLNKEGIPTYAGTKEGYFAAMEIGVLLDYLRVLGNKRQDIPLAAVLKSCICGLTDGELAAVRSFHKDGPFYDAAESYMNIGQDETIKKKLIKFFCHYKAFRSIISYTPIHELLWRILEDTGYNDYMSALPGGSQRAANLEMLVEKARVFESTSYKGLFHFIRYMEQLQKYDVDYGEASLEDEQSDTVRIMTIHKSKGLEFPIVIVAGMGKQFNMQDARSNVVLHARLGVGLNAVNLEKRTKSPSLLKRVIQKEESLDSLAEELRVLYVALTRAKEKLIITGTVNNIERKLEGMRMVSKRKEAALPFYMLSKAVTYWDWILPALERKTTTIPVQVYQITPEMLVNDNMTGAVAERLEKEYLINWDSSHVYDEKMLEKLKEEFSYIYPHNNTKAQKLKFTVSELKKRAYMEEEAGELPFEEEVVPLIPQFLQEAEVLTGASRGTAYHRLLELLDFTKGYDDKLLADAIEQFCQNQKMTKEMAECICLNDILAFLSSSAGKRMKSAALKGMLHKEQPFVLGVDAKEMYPGEPEGEYILVQGIIDVYFEEEELVVLDYKTDNIHNADALAEKYHSQLDYYAKALERLTGQKVKEKIIYSFALQEEIIL